MRVLIAEGEDIPRRTLEKAVTSWGYTVTSTSCGNEAWSVLDGHDAAQLAILDWELPGIDGAEVCRRVRACHSQRYTYLILLTARAERIHIVQGLQAGADDFLAKPFDPDELEQRLRAGARIVKLQDKLLATQETLRKQAAHDPLTGILNRGAIHDVLHRELDRCRREKSMVSVVMADLDHFKRINDTYGHQAGDAILQHAVKLIQSSVRTYDSIGRYGGEEFIAVLPGVDCLNATAIAERMRRQIVESPLSRNSDPIYLSVSLGVATARPDEDENADADFLIQKADLALYQAKNDGRNCVRYDFEGSQNKRARELQPSNLEPRKSVLVVDDDDLVREVICRWLAAAGYECDQAGGADTALQQLQSGNVQVVTLDIDMPGCSGLDLLPRIKQRFPETETIMLTASGKTEPAIEALTRGACGYLIKPVERDTLLSEVNKAFEQRQSRLNRRRYTSQLEKKVQEQTFAIRRAHEETIHRLITASMHRDEETGAHIRRVGLFSEVIADALGWPPAKVEQIRMAAPMHDVGKIGIPDAILQKPGKLSDKEFAVMKTHTTIGAEMLDGSESPMLQMAQEIALAHHERWDGIGYPKGLAETAIPEPARIVAIVDAYDALTHDRVYRAAFSEEKALGIMRSDRGSPFDPDLLDLFFDVLPEIRRIATENPDKWSRATQGSTPVNAISAANVTLEPMLVK